MALAAASSLCTKARFSATFKQSGQPPLRRPHSPSHPLRGGCLTLAARGEAPGHLNASPHGEAEQPQSDNRKGNFLACTERGFFRLKESIHDYLLLARRKGAGLPSFS